MEAAPEKIEKISISSSVVHETPELSESAEANPLETPLEASKSAEFSTEDKLSAVETPLHPAVDKQDPSRSKSSERTDTKDAQKTSSSPKESESPIEKPKTSAPTEKPQTATPIKKPLISKMHSPANGTKKSKGVRVKQSPISLKERMKVAAERRKKSGVLKEISLSSVGLSPNRLFSDRILIKDMKKLGQIGIGLFGAVDCVKHRETGELYALKVISKGIYKKEGIVKTLIMEKTCLSLLDSPFIIRLFSTMKTKQCCYFLLEFVNGGEFYELLSLHTYFSDAFAQFYASNVVLAFEHMHAQGIVYRDLKPENLMLATNGYVKVIDLGFAKKIGTEKTFTYCGTPDYLAPEIIEELGHSYAVDWWTLGVLIYEMLIGRGPFRADTNEKIFKKATSGKVKFPRQLTLHADGIIRAFLKQNPNDRLGVENNTDYGVSLIKEHEWFQNIDWAEIRAQRTKAPHVPSETQKTGWSGEEEAPYMELSHDSDGLFQDF